MATLPGTPKTWTGGAVLTASDLNAELRDSLSFLADKPRCKVLMGATGGSGAGNQNLTSGSTAYLVFKEESYDTDSIHDNSTNSTRLTMVRAGLWRITGSAEFLGNVSTDGTRVLSIRLNGSTVLAAPSQRAVTFGTGPSTIVQASVDFYTSTTTDYVELGALQDSGSSIAVQRDDARTWFSAHWVGE